MQPGSERRRHHRVKKEPPSTLRISYEERAGYPKKELVVNLLDSSADGLRIGIRHPLPVGSVVFVNHRDACPNGKAELWSARVVWCSVDPGGAYSAGLSLVGPAQSYGTSNGGSTERGVPAVPDYYELMQLNQKADPDTVHRVYRLLAQRFHPDNRETGNTDVFRQLLEAYRVLSDPEQRAAYDVQYGKQNKRRWKIFDQSEAMQGRGIERTKRNAILAVLYTRRVNEPGQPAMTIHEIEDLLGCPREHLEFSIWFLKEKGFLAKGDNGRVSITVAGAEEAEKDEIPWAALDRQLTSRV